MTTRRLIFLLLLIPSVAFGTWTIQDHTGINPGDFMPLAGSPAIDNGADLSAFFTYDFVGLTRPQNSVFDIGAYEYDPAPAGPDTTPDPFSFGSITNAALSTQYTTDNVTFAGIDTQMNVTISGAGCTWSKNGAAFSASAGTAVIGDNAALRGTSSGSYSTVSPSCTLTAGGVSNVPVWSVTTMADPAIAVPPALSGGIYVGGGVTIQ